MRRRQNGGDVEGVAKECENEEIYGEALCERGLVVKINAWGLRGSGLTSTDLRANWKRMNKCT